MSLFTERQLIQRVENQLIKGYTGRFPESIDSKARLIIESVKPDYGIYGIDEYDIFLSHSSDDAVKVAGLKLELEDMGYKVYVDWINDPQLDRSGVNKKTAEKLKATMNVSRSLFYAFSENSSESRWMPWELGYFDGIKKKAAVLPILKLGNTRRYKGTEYLEMYYYITKGKASDDNEYLWIRESADKYVRYDWWIEKNKEPYFHNSI